MSLIVEILESFLGKNRGHNSSSGQMQFDCPACSEEQDMPQGNGKGNLEVNYNRGFFHCWSCGDRNRMKGKIPYLIKRFGNPKILKDFLIVKPEFNIVTELGDNHIVKFPEHFHLLSKASPTHAMYGEAMYYLKKRGITEDIIKEKKIGYCSAGKYKGRIIIPSYDSMGDLNFFIGRAFQKWVKPKILNEDIEKSTIIFNEYLINWDSTIYLVEGPFDHLVTPNSIPLLGKVLHDYIFFLLQTKAKADVIIVLDGDAYKDSLKLYKKLNVGYLRGRVKIVQLGQKYDPSNIYEKFGKKVYTKVLGQSKRILESRL